MNDWLIVPHPIGNFTAVPGKMSTGYTGYRCANLNDPAFYLLDEALDYANRQPLKGWVNIHPDVLWVPRSKWGVRFYKLRRWMRGT
jgi:hypothetical protein